MKVGNGYGFGWECANACAITMCFLACFTGNNGNTSTFGGYPPFFRIGDGMKITRSIPIWWENHW